jgi:hypothetical protein
MKKTRFLFLLLLISFAGNAQNSLNPSEYLTYDLGTRFTFHSEMEGYVDYIVKTNPRQFMKLSYGKSEEGRSLFIVIYSSEKNLKNYESIRINHLRNLHLMVGDSEIDETLISWYAFNIHGDEAVGTETAIALLHHLANKSPNENEIIIIDPCQNPDGRERYVQRHNSSYFRVASPLSQSWPEGRYNHYLSDLNRDWVWQVQKESKQRVKLYNAWMPHVFADFHEMEVEKSYFFPPPAEPVHASISSWQKNMLGQIGTEMATLFKAKKWDYFTQKEFDLLYPSYGDTFSTFNGAIGLTLEQGGGDKAGIHYIKDNGETLTLKGRIEKHFEVAKKLNEITAKNRLEIIENQIGFHLNTEATGEGPYESFIIKNSIPAKTQVLTERLDRLQIKYQFAKENLNSSGYHFQTGLTNDFTIEKGDLIVTTFQPKGHLVRVLFEPKTFMTDVKTYDISAWSLPFLHHLDTYGVLNDVKGVVENIPESKDILWEEFAFSISYNSASAVKFITDGLKLGALMDFTNAQKVIITKENNSSIYQTLFEFADSLKLEIEGVDKKEYKRLLKEGLSAIQKPSIGIIQGENISSTDLGDILYYFDHFLTFPFTQIWYSELNEINYEKFDILIFTDGGYKDFSINQDKLKQWLADGGKLVLIKDALHISNEINIGQMKRKNIDEIKYSRDKDKATNLVQGAMFNIPIDHSSPFRFGLSNGYNFLFEHLPEFQSKGSKTTLNSSVDMSNLLSGYIGKNASNFMEDSFVLGTYYFGNGIVYQMATNPLFRGILEDGKIIMGNVLFLPKR